MVLDEAVDEETQTVMTATRRMIVRLVMTLVLMGRAEKHGAVAGTFVEIDASGVEAVHQETLSLS